MLRRIFRILAWVTTVIAAIPVIFFIYFWAKYRIPQGPVITGSSDIRYQVIDLGQNESDSRTLIEFLTLNRRLFLSDGQIPFIYMTKANAAKCWPESPFEMSRKGYTIRVTYRVRRLRFHPGYTPASDIQIHYVSGQPQITK